MPQYPLKIPAPLGWANRPSAAGAAGLVARFTMPDGRVVPMVSDGVRWKPLGAYVVAQPNANVTANTNEATLASVSIPGGLLGADGALRVLAVFSFTGTAGIKTMRMKFGGTTFVNSGPANTTLSASVFRVISNLSATSQVAIPVTAAEGGAQASVIVTGAVDTTADQQLVVAVQLASGADSATLTKLIVEVL